MAGKQQKEQTIGSIIRQMVADGESFEKIKQSLLGLDVPAGQAEVLVNLYKLRVSPQIEENVRRTLENKMVFAEKAGKRSPALREASLQRRRNAKLQAMLKEVSRVSFPNAAKRKAIQKIVSDYSEMLQRETEMKKELNRVLLEALDEKLSRRDTAKLRNAIMDLKEL